MCITASITPAPPPLCLVLCLVPNPPPPTSVVLGERPGVPPPLPCPAVLQPNQWLFEHDGHYYINLPPEDNWSEYHPLISTWQKLRIQGQIARGQSSVYVDLTDTTYVTSNGRTSPAQSHTYMTWGVAKDCRGAPHTSAYRLNLRGTPFRLGAAGVAPRAWGPAAFGDVACARGQTACEGRCGGACGACGLRYGQDAQLVQLVVVDQGRFDDAIPSSCGPPDMPNVDFSDCEYRFAGQCNPVCRCGGARAASWPLVARGTLF